MIDRRGGNEGQRQREREREECGISASNKYIVCVCSFYINQMKMKRIEMYFPTEYHWGLLLSEPTHREIYRGRW